MKLSIIGSDVSVTQLQCTHLFKTNHQQFFIAIFFLQDKKSYTEKLFSNFQNSDMFRWRISIVNQKSNVIVISDII